ncbi:conserved Plasmodium protein, unknown function [Plasmodium berghei]|uniref:Uncharacterized protein n=2 Tax=Plasmodium berghei TaxID=5821 RepID=A0A509AUI5_PLABA|nr:conserved Plasmodium protein, unknown function [Plasmodium berghei ANKA]CXJ14663.1 conserved Plasmodium protein, unknown function [Plasmodium berghei]SCM26206.1 conserved Plasmodium protein, unknown function [Plasmodium berghei]SCN28332.1 conserved Plasmodium protein, unknown function [Plasmodium berghei]SCO62530.1 conserved Plasmodium protein, unknown function [Plasmodium berghei]SCO64088.1 conserved Plasmodium protein, unknown function [Plasmodium berghei]|eukprot:XP_034423984.1 conserved Plasmodium protein, unknown function [Plasmodium berghei ANKA]
MIESEYDKASKETNKFEKIYSSDEDVEKYNMISLRDFNICYKNKLEKLNTIKNIDNNKKILKLVLEDVNLDPKEVMEKVVKLLKNKTSLYTIIEINNQKYKLKYTEVEPDDNILFTENVHNIANCKYAYIGILKISKYLENSTFQESFLQSWQNIPMDF